jgi:hypothetical protein
MAIFGLMEHSVTVTKQELQGLLPIQIDQMLLAKGKQYPLTHLLLCQH